MSTFDYFLIALPVFIWYIVKALGMDFAREICAIFQSVVYTREYSSSRVQLKQSEENILLKVIKAQTRKSLRELQDCTVKFIPRKAKWWYLGGSATILCSVYHSRDGQSVSMSILLTVRYKQQFSVKPWLIVDIAAFDAIQ